MVDSFGARQFVDVSCRTIYPSKSTSDVMIRILVRRKVALTVCFLATGFVISLHFFPNLENESEQVREINEDGASGLTSTFVVADVRRVLDNATTISALPREIPKLDLHRIPRNISVPSFPGVFTYLPHLVSRPYLLNPKTNISQNKSNVSFVIGIPSIRRPIGVYIFDTLKSLFTGINKSEKNDVLIIVCIAEPLNETYGKEVIEQLYIRFPAEISQGQLDIITPHAGFYPDLDHLKPTLGDSQERVKWRSKQNLDYAFLILHAWSRGKYYLQLEDDLTAVPGYISSMKETIEKNYWDWFSLEFSTLGFIGRLFRSEDALKIMEFLLMFYSSKPCDWLYDDYLQVKMCGHGEKWSKCLHKIQNIARSIKPSLFQHEGLRSSLGGTLNKLKDKGYGVSVSTMIFNPPVESIITTLQTYSKYDIYSAYSGHDIFWGANPKEGDLIDFLFDTPIPLAKVYIETGNKEHPKDILQNATLEILPQKIPPVTSPLYKMKVNNNVHGVTAQQKLAFEQRLSSNPALKNLPTNDTFFGVGKFDNAGVASFDISEDAGKIWVLRLLIHSTSPNWVVIKKIEFQVR